MSDREAIIQKVRETWPEVGTGYYEKRGGLFTAPPVRDGGVTARLIEHAVDTVLAELEATK